MAIVRTDVPNAKCCGIRVETCAKIVALIGIVICAMCLINIFVPSISMSFWALFFPQSTVAKYQLTGLIILNIIGFSMFVINLLLLHGANKEKPWAFLPYLIVNGIWIAFWLMLVAFLFIMGNFAPDTIIDNLPRKDVNESTVKTFCNVTSVLILIMNFIPMFFWLLVYRAYRHVKQLHGGPHDNAALLNH